jgi:hypothetical protein
MFVIFKKKKNYPEEKTCLAGENFARSGHPDADSL